MFAAHAGLGVPARALLRGEQSVGGVAVAGGAGEVRRGPTHLVVRPGFAEGTPVSSRKSVRSVAPTKRMPSMVMAPRSSRVTPCSRHYRGSVAAIKTLLADEEARR